MQGLNYSFFTQILGEIVNLYKAIHFSFHITKTREIQYFISNSNPFMQFLAKIIKEARIFLPKVVALKFKPFMQIFAKSLRKQEYYNLRLKH